MPEVTQSVHGGGVVKIILVGGMELGFPQSNKHRPVDHRDEESAGEEEDCAQRTRRWRQMTQPGSRIFKTGGGIKTLGVRVHWLAMMSVDQDFSSVPVLDYALAKEPATRLEFLNQLRHTLINVGFLYLSNPPVSQDDIHLAVNYAPKLFTLPQEKKDRLLMRNSPHFLGYTKIGAEYTKGKVDQREQYDFATPYECRWTPGAPEYLRLRGPSQVSVIDPDALARL